MPQSFKPIVLLGLDGRRHFQVVTSLLFTFPVCSTKPVIDAQVATPHGHTFCGHCVDMFQQMAGQIPCATCRQVVVKFCQNIFANKVLSTKHHPGKVHWVQ